MLLTPEQQALFDDNSVDKSLTLRFFESTPTLLYPGSDVFPNPLLFPGYQAGTTPVVTLTDSDIKAESMSITESVCNSNELKFGTVTANKMTATVNSQTDVKGLILQATLTAESTELPIFYGVVDSTKIQTNTNRNLKTITAYDILYSYLDVDCTNWYNSLTFPMTILELRTALARTFGLEYVWTDLVNDSLEVERYTLTSALTARNLLKYICEINGVFANVDRYNRIVFLSLTPFSLLYPQSTLYPSSDLYSGIQSASIDIANIENYKASYFGEYRTKEIGKVEVYGDSNTLLGSYGTGDNIYKISDNILASAMSSTDLATAIQNLYTLVHEISYAPISLNTQSKPYLEVGDTVQFPVGNKSVSSFILNRTLTGTAKDKLEAKGNEYHNKEYVVESEG